MSQQLTGMYLGEKPAFEGPNPKWAKVGNNNAVFNGISRKEMTGTNGNPDWIAYSFEFLVDNKKFWWKPFRIFYKDRSGVPKPADKIMNEFRNWFGVLHGLAYHICGDETPKLVNDLAVSIVPVLKSYNEGNISIEEVEALFEHGDSEGNPGIKEQVLYLLYTCTMDKVGMPGNLLLHHQKPGDKQKYLEIPEQPYLYTWDAVKKLNINEISFFLTNGGTFTIEGSKLRTVNLDALNQELTQEQAAPQEEPAPEHASAEDDFANTPF